jgi:uncharacterized protein YcfJ
MVYLNRIVLLVIAGIVLSNAGCNSMAGTGAVAGGGIGAATGALIGHATGNPKTGAVLGTALGAGIGTAIGADADERKQKREDNIRLAEANAAAANAPQFNGPLGMTDVIALSEQGVSDDVIISYLRQTNSTFRLSPNDLAYLREKKVTDRVVTEMINSTNRVAIRPAPAPRTVIVQEPPQTVIIERPWRPYYYAPPPPLGFGFSYTRFR